MSEEEEVQPPAEEEEEADAPAEEEEEEEPKEEAAPEAEEEEEEQSLIQSEFHRTIDNAEVCCCCICQCNYKETEKESCCGCMPIKCGVVSIGVLTIVLTVTSFSEIFYMILNEYIHWWYVLVALLLLVPTVIASAFTIVFFNQDQDSTRGKLRVSYIFMIISFSLLAVWNIVYFNAWYKNPDVYIGSAEAGYFKQTKKQYVFWSIFCSLIIDGLYAYFICVVASYKNAMKNRKDPNADEEATK